MATVVVEGVGFVHCDLAQVEDDRHAMTREQLGVIIDRGCIKCGAQTAPEPTDEERARILADADFHWFPPDGEYLYVGFGLMGGGYGTYVCCDRCGFFAKHDLGPEAE